MKTKRLLAMFAALLMILCLAACGDGGSANKYTYEGVSLALPEGFTVDENSATPIAYGPDYPDNTDNITFSYSGADSIDNYSQEVFETYYSALLGEVTSNSFEKVKVGGKDAIEYNYSLSVNGVEMEQTQVMVFLSDKTVTVTFTNASGEYDSAFEQAIDSISAK